MPLGKAFDTRKHTRKYPISFRVFTGIFTGMTRTALNPFKNTAFTPDLLRLIGEIDEFKGLWKALGNLAPDRLATLRRVATVESVGASTRIEGAKLSDA